MEILCLSQLDMVYHKGSVLGPLLFLVYINDIINCFHTDDIKLVLYADDTNIFITGSNKIDLITKGNEVLEINI